MRTRGTIDCAGVVILAMLTLAACETATGPGLPLGATSIQPLAVYERWWKMTEQCSGLRGDFNHVLFYQVPGATSFSFRSIRNVPGIWMEDDRIILAGQSTRDGQVVRHQMLHSLMKEGHHTRERFLGDCGGSVECGETCLADAGPPLPPDLNAVIVEPSALDVSVSVWPASPGPDVLDGYVEVIVTARNASNRAVHVTLPPPNGAPGAPGAPGITFRHNLASKTGAAKFARDEKAFSMEATHFSPGEVKRRVFEFWVGGTATQAPLQAGDYQAQGAYADQWAPAPQSLLVRH